MKAELRRSNAKLTITELCNRAEKETKGKVMKGKQKTNSRKKGRKIHGRKKHTFNLISLFHTRRKFFFPLFSPFLTLKSEKSFRFCF
jgi:hypothetical protein